ncbi:hypothetical protein [Nocardioides aurantiacus]|uniref:DNA-directed RNA polymerase specialized sigma24 family protein n=1 Tax=Nocardioides aurantiacus TaxID=86796 RepID=A0A3N2CUC5_9ACTN|nr:hypothetical protein [Nocardioides aurantiacus]ROR91127.1 hypothetical protein EDD33_1988 [Nocardioides aurantiacus]
MSQRDRATTSLLSVGMTACQLERAVAGPVWARWAAAEPALAGVGSLQRLENMRGAACDPGLGALVRIAAGDGRGAELAAIAVVHQLEGGLRRLCWRLRDLSDDIEAVVVGELWRQIRTFPWQRRTRAYAANLLLDTRAAVLRELHPDRDRDGQQRVVLVEGDSTKLDLLIGAQPAEAHSASGSEATDREFVQLVRWARSCRAISGDDVDLLVDLLEAGHQVDSSDRCTRGVSSDAALRLVAERRGVCTKTVVRHRNRVLDALRAAAPRYLSEVA